MHLPGKQALTAVALFWHCSRVRVPTRRPYVRLTDYEVVEPEMGEVIKRKLTTKVGTLEFGRRGAMARLAIVGQQ